MFPAVFVVTSITSTLYRGVDLDIVRRYARRDYIEDAVSGRDWVFELKEAGAYSPDSFPLYHHLIAKPTTEADQRVKLRRAVCVLVADAHGDRSSFVPVGIELLSEPAMRHSASKMLAKVASKKNLPAIRRLVDLNDPKMMWRTTVVLGLLAEIGDEEDWALLYQAAEAEAVRADRDALVAVTAARNWADGRFATKAKLKPDR